MALYNSTASSVYVDDNADYAVTMFPTGQQQCTVHTALWQARCAAG